MYYLENMCTTHVIVTHVMYQCSCFKHVIHLKHHTCITGVLQLAMYLQQLVELIVVAKQKLDIAKWSTVGSPANLTLVEPCRR